MQRPVVISTETDSTGNIKAMMLSHRSKFERRTRRRYVYGTLFLTLIIVTYYDTSVVLSGLNSIHGRFLQELGNEPKIPSPLEDHPYGPWDNRVMENVMYRKLNENSDGEESDSADAVFTKRPLSFLTLGGSITWGGALRHRYDAFPYLLQQLHPDNVVDNRALRATGAHFPAACIQSLVEGDAFPEWEFTPGDVNREPKEYDVILLEFSVNGFAHTDFLLRRLRKRYPKALIVYVHLHSLTNPPPTNMEEEGFFEKILEPVQGYHWKIDVPSPSQSDEDFEYDENFLKLYNEDKHHLSEVGHKHVADELMKLLDEVGPGATTSEEEENDEDQAVGSWGAGDQCFMWLGTWGHFQTSLSANGGEFKIFDVPKKKYAYEIEYGKKATFAFERQIGATDDGKGLELPINLVTMIKVSDEKKYCN